MNPRASSAIRTTPSSEEKTKNPPEEIKRAKTDRRAGKKQASV